MDRQYIRDEQVIERYLQGRLTPAEEQDFEETYLSDPEVLNELLLTEKLREGAKDLAGARPQAQPDARRTATGGGGSAWYALAASLVAAVALATSGWLYIENQSLRGGAVVAAAGTRVLPLLTVRGGGDVNTVAAPAPDELVVLLLDPGFAEYDVYRASLLREEGAEPTPILRSAELAPTYEGLLAFAVPGTHLAPGVYQVELEGRSRDWPASRAGDSLARTPLTVR